MTTNTQQLLPKENEAILISPSGELTRVPMPNGYFTKGKLCKLLDCKTVKFEDLYHKPTKLTYTLYTDSKAGAYQSSEAPTSAYPINGGVSALWQEVYSEYIGSVTHRAKQITKSVYGTVLIHINNDLPF